MSKYTIALGLFLGFGSSVHAFEVVGKSCKSPWSDANLVAAADADAQRHANLICAQNSQPGPAVRQSKATYSDYYKENSVIHCADSKSDYACNAKEINFLSATLAPSRECRISQFTPSLLQSATQNIERTRDVFLFNNNLSLQPGSWHISLKPVSTSNSEVRFVVEGNMKLTNGSDVEVRSYDIKSQSVASYTLSGGILPGRFTPDGNPIPGTDACHALPDASIYIQFIESSNQSLLYQSNAFGRQRLYFIGSEVM